MNIVFLEHPEFFYSQSMPRFARNLTKGMLERGHEVQIWKPRPFFFKIPIPSQLKKFLGYLDQYILFPVFMLIRMKKLPTDTLFVFTDQALGPWVPIVKNRPHVIHCHDFLAQRSALGEIKENKPGWTGSYYQAFIRNGFSLGKNFISVSERTKEDLSRFLPSAPAISEVVYNGLNQAFSPNEAGISRKIIGEITKCDLTLGYILHVGGNDWYKNRIGVIEIYNAWRKLGKKSIPLLLVGSIPDKGIIDAFNQSLYKSDIFFAHGLDDEFVRLAYSGASVFLFPSLEEGFGWPIAEAMASGCPVITTDEAPMSEVGANAAFYIPKRPIDNFLAESWAIEGARILDKVLNLSLFELKELIELSLENSKRFDPIIYLDKIEKIYNRILFSETELGK